ETSTNLREASASVRPAVEAASGRIEEIAKRVDPAKVEDTLNRLNGAVTHADTLMAEAKPHLLATIESVRSLSTSLQDFTAKNRPRVETLLDGLNGTRARLDNLIAHAGVIASQGAEFMTHNRANLERTTLNIRDATDSAKKLVQKIYGNP